jgi:hypothetical protein
VDDEIKKLNAEETLWHEPDAGVALNIVAAEIRARGE